MYKCTAVYNYNNALMPTTCEDLGSSIIRNISGSS